MVERQEGKGGSYESSSFTGYGQAAPQVSTLTKCGGTRSPVRATRIASHPIEGAAGSHSLLNVGDIESALLTLEGP